MSNYSFLLLFVLTLVYGKHVKHGKHDECDACDNILLSFGENVIQMSDASYDTVRLSKMDAASLSSIEDRDRIVSPTIIIIPKTENEIIEIIKFANKCGYTISIKSGGHQYSGLSSCINDNGQCIQIDMKYFDYININHLNSQETTTITVGSGVKLLDLYTALEGMDVAILGGICATVAAGGHYQSSSQSVWSRSLGLGMDYIIRVKIITANGKILNVYKGMDLFWAILGGSPGSWGVVIEYEFEPIKNLDYPYSRYYSYGHLYTKQGFTAFFNAFINILNNPYYSNYNDMTIWFAGTPRLSDPNTSLSVSGTVMSIFLSWTGIDNDNIFDMIPNHPLNKTWYQELVQPFIDIDKTFEKTQINELKYEGATTISSFLYEKAQTIGRNQVIPQFRKLNVQHQYNKTTMNKLFSDNDKKTKYIQSIIDKFDELASDSNDNVEILWQFWDLFKNEDENLSHDALKNAVSYPLRSMKLQSDIVILFGDGDNYTDNVLLKAKKYQYELKQILKENFIKSDLKSYAYTDLLPNEYNLNEQYNQFYDYREDIYYKLKDIKTRVDANNIFKGPLTIPPN